jgi:hypothetical protein
MTSAVLDRGKGRDHEDFIGGGMPKPQLWLYQAMKVTWLGRGKGAWLG